MPSAVEILAERVAAAADLIASLRTKVQSLERELLTQRSRDLFLPETPAQPPSDPVLTGELERLRAERIMVREGIRGLLREIDRVSW